MHLFAVLILVFLAGSHKLLAQDLKPGHGLKNDAEALRFIKREIENDPSGALRDWDAQANPCQWHGVECARVPAASLSEHGEQEVEDRVVSLELWGLELGGVISSQIGKLSELRKLAIVGNKLTGSIPPQIRNCQKLNSLDLRANDLSGAIDFSLTDFPLLEKLKLSENRLTGTLSALFADRKSYGGIDPFHVLDNWIASEEAVARSCPHLQFLDLSRNSLSGKISMAIGECTQLSEVSLNGNGFSGKIPATLSAIPHLHSLFLNENVLEGPLPSVLALGCKELQYLNVADNLLSGSIPVEFTDFGGARSFNFSNNLLQGPIPLGKWRVQQMALDGSFSSNPSLCGWPVIRVCEISQQRSLENLPLQSQGSLFYRAASFAATLNSRLQTLGQHIFNVRDRGEIELAKALGRRRRSMAEAATASATPARHRNRHFVRRWALGLSLGLVAGALSAILLATLLRLCIFYMAKGPYLQGPIIFHPNITPKMLLFLEKDESLSEAELVGEGGAGRVYKAQLENGIVVAVKSVAVKEDQKGMFGQKQIQAELETLGCIRHRNLVVMLAYVNRPNSHLLLYEYMENGSLYRALQKVNAGELELPWPIRHRIAVGTSQGLSYLHFLSNPRIVHRDLKPSNILLDANFVAHVSDFGLAKVIPGEDTHVTTGLAGTLGYIAPEYSQTCRYTDKSDVYSFGVVLAVLLTGKDPTDQFFHTVPGGGIGSWLHDLMQRGEGADAIHPKLRTEDNLLEEEILLAMKIAVFCTNADPKERPSSKDVLIMLKQIRIDEEP